MDKNKKYLFKMKRRTLLYLFVSLGLLFGLITVSIIPLFKTNFVFKGNLWRYVYLLIYSCLFYYFGIREFRKSIIKSKGE